MKFESAEDYLRECEFARNLWNTPKIGITTIAKNLRVSTAVAWSMIICDVRHDARLKNLKAKDLKKTKKRLPKAKKTFFRVPHLIYKPSEKLFACSLCGNDFHGLITAIRHLESSHKTEWQQYEYQYKENQK